MITRRSSGELATTQKDGATTKTRVQFDFSPDAYERLTSLMEASGAKTKAETVRNALSLYEWFINEVHPEDTIQVKDCEGEITSSFKAKLLRRL